MSLGVLNNLSAMYAENNLNNTTTSLNKTVCSSCLPDRRSTPARTTRPVFRWSMASRPIRRPSTQSQTNATEGVGLLQVADGALSQVTSLLNRAVTLATEASNGTLNVFAGYGGQPGVPVDPVGDHNIGSTTTYNQEQVFGSNTNHLHRRLLNPGCVDRPAEHSWPVFGGRRRYQRRHVLLQRSDTGKRVHRSVEQRTAGGHQR